MRKTIYQIFEGEDPKYEKVSRFVNGFIIVLILLNLVAIICESVESLMQNYGDFFVAFEEFSIVVFSIEYLLRLWIAPLKFPHLSPAAAVGKYMISAIAIIDLIAIIPFFLPLILTMDLRFVRALRLVRLLRLLKLSRYSKTMQLVGQVLREKKIELVITILVTVVLLVVASIIMFFIEHEAQPEQFPNIFATFWWAVATLTTVGYGDIYPITGWGKLVSAIIALLGIGLVALPTGILSSSFIEIINKQNKEEEVPPDYFKYCPHCGKKLYEHD